MSMKPYDSKRTFRNTRGQCEMVDRYINVERYFEYLDNMESYFADIHTDITKDVSIRAQAREAQIQYWMAGQILAEYLKLGNMWEE